MEHLPSKADGVLGRDDIFVLFGPGGGGFGDPLEREVERVATDVENGSVSVEQTEAVYGVVINTDDTVDKPGTKGRREAIRTARKQTPPADWTPEDSYTGTDGSTVSDGLALGTAGSEIRLHCRGCGHQITGTGGSALKRIAALSHAGLRLALRWGGDSPNFALKEIICPTCTRLVSVSEVKRSS